MHVLRPTRLVLVVAANLALLAGCSGSTASPAAGITVTDAWGVQ
jgi:ABC-type glycerol-3-phosphate transport system substrate-binding protein